MAHLFSPMRLRGLTLRNGIMMSPMCMYSAGDDGLANDWHVSHYGARATGGAGLLVTEATAVEPRGRISQRDLGLWSDAQIEPLARVVRLVQAEGAAIGVQLAHAGRKAWTQHKGDGPEEGGRRHAGPLLLCVKPSISPARAGTDGKAPGFRSELPQKNDNTRWMRGNCFGASR